MTHVKTNKRMYVLGGIAVYLLVSAVIVGCSQSQSTTDTAAPAVPEDAVDPAPRGLAALGRSEIWAQNCSRCHNIRDPKSYSDTEWEVALHHMRVRANLLPAEQKAVLELMQASN